MYEPIPGIAFFNGAIINEMSADLHYNAYKTQNAEWVTGNVEERWIRSDCPGADSFRVCILRSPFPVQRLC